MSLPSNTNASLSTSFYAPRDSGGALVGVTSLNGLIGITAITGDASMAVSTPGLGAVQVSTAGRPQVPSSVTATGAVIGATVTATGVLAGASANIAGNITAGNMLPSQQVITAYATTPGSVFFFSQVGGIGTVIGQGVSNASGVIIVGLPAGRTGNCIGGSCTPAGNNTGGTAGIYGVTFLPTASTPPGPNQAAFGTIDRTTSSSQAGITAFVTACFVLTN